MQHERVARNQLFPYDNNKKKEIIMSVESTRRALEYSSSFTSGIDMPGLDRRRLNAWVTLVHSGEMTYRITSRTPQLNRIEQLCRELMNSFYDITLWVFHGGIRCRDLIQRMLNDAMNHADEVKALIEATPEEDTNTDDGYGADVRDDSYGVEVAEQGYGVAPSIENDDSIHAENDDESHKAGKDDEDVEDV